MNKDLSNYSRRVRSDGKTVIDVPAIPKLSLLEKIERRVRKRTIEQLSKMSRRLEKGVRSTIRRLNTASSPGLTIALTLALQTQFATQGAVAKEIERRTE
jgi:RNA 3'-terminal phosphate cyclase